MQVNDPATYFIVAQEAQHRWMVAIGNAGKQLEPALEQDCLDTMLMLSGDEKIEVALARQGSMNSPAALPKTI
jgi:hypothetical protein